MVGLPKINYPEIEDLYRIDPLEVRQFISENDFLVPIIFEAHQKIREIFGMTAELWLELERDPEECFEELFIVIKTNLSAKLGRELLRKLTIDWFLGIMDKTKGKLNITEEHL